MICRVKQGYASPILQGFLGSKAVEYFKDLLSKRLSKILIYFALQLAVHHILETCSNRMGAMDQLTTLYVPLLIPLLIA